MSDDSNSEDDFEVQLKFEKAEQKKKDEGQGKTRVDEDGTVMEFDAEKKAWFPKIDADFIAQYQMNYGTDNSQTTTPDTSSENTWMPDTNSEHYAYWYYNIYMKTPDQDPANAYQDYYNYYYQSYYQSQQQEANVNDKNTEEKGSTEMGEEKKSGSDESKGESGSEKDSGKDGKKETEEELADKAKDAEAAEKAYQEYYEFYKDYYENYADTSKAKKPMDMKQFTQSSESYEDIQARVQQYFREEEEEEEDEKASGKAQEEGEPREKKKRKANDTTWFEIDDDHNTNVYVTSMPPDVTEEEFVERMNKFGLIVYDPRTRKPKVKLYRNDDGTVKGDGLCCYIKSESVDLALMLLDGADWRGSKVCVEKAKFELKGAYDPKKKKKKLSNKQKRDMKEKQKKLFDWRPDKLIGERPKCEKTLIIKNLFELSLFERDPTQLVRMKADVEKECKKYGEVRRVVIHDRHSACCASVSFASASDADNCKEFLHNRFFKGRALAVETWDGKTKYTVEETPEQREARLAQWARYLEEPTPAVEGTSATPAAGDTSTTPDSSTGQGESTGDSSSAEATEKSDIVMDTAKDEETSSPEAAKDDGAPVDEGEKSSAPVAAKDDDAPVNKDEKTSAPDAEMDDDAPIDEGDKETSAPGTGRSETAEDTAAAVGAGATTAKSTDDTGAAAMDCDDDDNPNNTVTGSDASES